MTGSENSEHLSKMISILQKNPAIGGNVELAKKIVEQGELRSFRKGEALISYGDNNDYVFFILSGTVDIKVPYLDTKQRAAPNQIGEMAAMKPEMPRSATVSAKTELVETISIRGAQFREHADQNPQFRNRLADEMDRRHRQRLEPSKDPKSGIFDRPAAWLAICAIAAVIVTVLTNWLLLATELGPLFRFGINIATGLFVFTFLFWKNPNYFYRKLLIIVVACGVLDRASTGVFDFKSPTGFGPIIFKADRTSGPYDFVPWVVVALALLFADIYQNRSK